MSRADGVVNGPAESDAVLGALPRISRLGEAAVLPSWMTGAAPLH
jgi:hypothetical protein